MVRSKICTRCGFESYIGDDIQKAYEQGRADAERDFQNSDYWNDYLAKVIADAKADAIDEWLKEQK